MKPQIHAKRSAHKFGGRAEDYIAIHEWFDQTKAAHADMRHRAILHNAMGCYIAAQVFGDDFGCITTSDGKRVPVRDVAEQHVLDDLGCIPSLSDILNHLPHLDVLGGVRRLTTFRLED